MATNTYAGFYSPSGGASPDDVKRRKSYAESLLSQGMDASAVQHPLQAVARALQGAMGGYLTHTADRDGKEEQAKATQALMAALGNQPSASAGESRSQTIYPSVPQVSAAPGNPSDPRGIRNNNPLNIEAGQFTQGMPGFAGSDGRFAKFESPDQGLAAADRLLQTYNQKHGLNTVSGVIGRWAPSSDGNNVGNYAGFVAKKLGVAPDQPLDMDRPEVRQALAVAMAEFENGRPVSTSQPARAAQATATTPTAPAAAGGLPVNTMNVLKAASSPWLGAMGQTIAGKVLEKQLTPRDQWVDEKGKDGSFYQRNLVTGERKVLEKSDVLPPEAVKQKVEIATAGKPVTTIDQRAPDEFEKEYGQGMGKRALATLEAGDKAVANLQRFNIMDSLLSSVETGKLAGTQATIGAWAKAAGLDPAKIGIDPNLPMVSEASKSFMAQSVIGQIGAGGFPANNFSNPDREFLTGTVPQLGMQPGANKLLLEVGRRVAQRDIDKANAWADAREQKISHEAFERDWRKKVAGEDLFKDIKEQIKTMQNGQYTPPTPEDIEAEIKRRKLR